MGKLPNHDKAIIPQAKIADYLLSLTHRDGLAVFCNRISVVKENKHDFRIGQRYADRKYTDIGVI